MKASINSRSNSAGTTPHSNPIVLDASGRVPSGEIWLTDGSVYKFVLKDSNDVLIATYDNLVGINSNFVNFTNQQEIQTATAGQTVFNLTTMTYQPGTNSLSVFVDGVNQYGPGASYAYLETDSDTVTFTTGLHVGAEVKFTTSNLNSSAGGDAFNVGYLPPFTGSVGTNVGDKLAEIVSVKDFGAVGDGVTDDTAAFVAAANYAATIVLAGTSNNDIVTAGIYIPAGVYFITSTIPIKNCVQWFGDGSGATCVLVSGAGVNGFEVDDPSPPTGQDYSNIRFNGFTLQSDGTAQDGFVISGLIRNCAAQDVVVKGFRDSWSFQETWTFRLQECCSYNATRHHINAGAATGGLHIYGGRYDVAADHGIYMDSATGELIMDDVAVQFGSAAAVFVENSRTVDLYKCFFEGNCIGNPSNYYVELRNTSSLALSSVVVHDCVMNNLSDSNRNGLGVCYVENYHSFNYRDRWSRNGVSVVPIIGSGIFTTNVDLNSSNNRSSALSNIVVGSQSHAMIRQNARPTGIFGQDMADVSFAPTTRAALNVGFNTIGVAIGTYDSHPAINGYGDSFRLKLNPGGGILYFGQTDLAVVDAGTNEFYGRFREITQAASTSLTPNATTGFVSVDCSGGNRTVTLTNIPADYGRRLTVAKNDAGANQITVTPKAGETINGSATWASTSAYASVSLIGNNGNWIIV